MVVDSICENNRNELCGNGKNQIGMQSLFILGPASRNNAEFKDIAEMVVDVEQPVFANEI